jgi:hypothetical protein
MEEMGWPVKAGHAFTERGAFDPLANVAFVPTLVQLSERHCIATIEDDNGKWIYDSNEEFALPLTRKALERSMGGGRPYEGAVRAYRFTPGKKACSGMQKRACEADKGETSCAAKKARR